jgi:hypothetical protein
VRDEEKPPLMEVFFMLLLISGKTHTDGRLYDKK